MGARLFPFPEPGLPFNLLPFPGDPHPQGLSLSGAVSRAGAQLAIRYRLTGPLQHLILPPPVAMPERQDDLWRTTCLECFLALPEDIAYWELNLSPAGHWNAYRLEAYREGLIPDPAFDRPHLALQPGVGGLELLLYCTLPAGLAEAPVLAMAVTAVIATAEGDVSHWALKHPGAVADFHRRDGFCLRV